MTLSDSIYYRMKCIVLCAAGGALTGQCLLLGVVASLYSIKLDHGIHFHFKLCDYMHGFNNVKANS